MQKMAAAIPATGFLVAIMAMVLGSAERIRSCGVARKLAPEAVDHGLSVSAGLSLFARFHAIAPAMNAIPTATQAEMSTYLGAAGFPM